MSPVPDITLGSLTLPGDMHWVDEFTGWAIGQDVQVSSTGAQIVQEAARQAGRPITLTTTNEGSNAYAATVTYGQVESLRQMALAGGTYELVMPAWPVGATRSFTVRFDQSNPIEANPIIRIVPAAPDDQFWFVTVRLFTV